MHAREQVTRCLSQLLGKQNIQQILLSRTRKFRFSQRKNAFSASLVRTCSRCRWQFCYLLVDHLLLAVFFVCSRFGFYTNLNSCSEILVFNWRRSSNQPVLSVSLSVDQLFCRFGLSIFFILFYNIFYNKSGHAVIWMKWFDKQLHLALDETVTARLKFHFISDRSVVFNKIKNEVIEIKRFNCRI